jgi:hypothetical protein
MFGTQEKAPTPSRDGGRGLSQVGRLLVVAAVRMRDVDGDFLNLDDHEASVIPGFMNSRAANARVIN